MTQSKRAGTPRRRWTFGWRQRELCRQQFTGTTSCRSLTMTTRPRDSESANGRDARTGFEPVLDVRTRRLEPAEHAVRHADQGDSHRTVGRQKTGADSPRERARWRPEERLILHDRRRRGEPKTKASSSSRKAVHDDKQEEMRISADIHRKVRVRGGRATCHIMSNTSAAPEPVYAGTFRMIPGPAPAACQGRCLAFAPHREGRVHRLNHKPAVRIGSAECRLVRGRAMVFDDLLIAPITFFMSLDRTGSAVGGANHPTRVLLSRVRDVKVILTSSPGPTHCCRVPVAGWRKRLVAPHDVVRAKCTMVRADGGDTARVNLSPFVAARVTRRRPGGDWPSS